MKHFALSLLLAFVVGQMWAQTLESDDKYFTAEGPFCIGSTIKFKVDDNNRFTEFSWNGGSFGTARTFETSFDDAGVYTVTLSGKFNSQSFSDEIDVEIFKSPEMAIHIDTTSQRVKRVFTDTAEHTYKISSYKWYFGDGSTDATEKTTSHSYAAAGSYTVSLALTDEHNCTDSVSETVVIEGLSTIPNVFTPNGDGQNDFFLITADNGSKLTLEIFNRWGYRMFRRTGTENIVWDGYNPQGTLVQPGTYYYVITVEEGSTNYNPLNGYITVFY